MQRTNNQFFSGFRMEDHEAQSAKNLFGEGIYLAVTNEVMVHSMCFIVVVAGDDASQVVLAV